MLKLKNQVELPEGDENRGFVYFKASLELAVRSMALVAWLGL
jgi:hypothetical protein